MSKRWEGWHWLRADGCLNYPPHTKVEVGQTLTVEPPIKLCNRGLHASRRAIDALHYAPGPIVCRVVLSGEIQEGDDKAVATERTVLAMADVTRTLHEFACDAAETACKRYGVTDERSFDAIRVKRLWLEGKATDTELAAAWAAAWDAAWSAAWDAAWSAARSTAWDAAWSAARSTARSTARSAAWDAARSAAWSAAWSAARSAAWDAQNTDLEARLVALLGISS